MPKITKGTYAIAFNKTKNININQCPITGGLPTSLTMSTFKALCDKQTRNRKMQKGFNYNQFESTIYDKFCNKCKQSIPPELTIITVEDYVG